MSAVLVAHPVKRIVLWFQDEAGIGQQGRPGHRWWANGRRPPGRRDQPFAWTYLFAVVAPATGVDVALVLPEARTATLNPTLRVRPKA